jgi:hypothetical protein
VLWLLGQPGRFAGKNRTCVRLCSMHGLSRVRFGKIQGRKYLGVYKMDPAPSAITTASAPRINFRFAA